jgi:putative acetyltransferase
LPLWRNEAALLNTFEVPHLSEDAIRERFNNSPANVHTLIAEVGLSSGRRQPVGVAWIETFHTRRRHAARLRILMLPAHRDSTLENALLEGVLHHVDQWTGLSRLETVVFVDDATGLALFERHGFEIEAHMRRFVMRGGAPADVYMLARLRPAPHTATPDASSPEQEAQS